MCTGICCAPCAQLCSGFLGLNLPRQALFRDIFFRPFHIWNMIIVPMKWPQLRRICGMGKTQKTLCALLGCFSVLWQCCMTSLQCHRGVSCVLRLLFFLIFSYLYGNTLQWKVIHVCMTSFFFLFFWGSPTGRAQKFIYNVNGNTLQCEVIHLLLFLIKHWLRKGNSKTSKVDDKKILLRNRMRQKRTKII